MPDVPVSLVPWFDAKDNPPGPDDGWPVATDGGVATYVEGEGQDLRPTGGAWYHGESSDYMDPQPTVWCDPSPPDRSDPLRPLTVDDLRDVGDLAEAFLLKIKAGPKATDWEAIARLRRALDQISTNERKDDT